MDKYRRPGVTLTGEKKRQEALERAGYRVVRVTWDDIHSEPAETLTRFQARAPTFRPDLWAAEPGSARTEPLQVGRKPCLSGS